MILKELAKQYNQEDTRKRVKIIEDDTVFHKGEFWSLPDFILVFKSSKVTLQTAARMDEFMRNLEDVGIMYDLSPYTQNNDVIFIKLYAPTSILHYCADLYFIELACNSATFKPPVKKPYFQFMRNELTDPLFNGIVHRRAPDCLNVSKPKRITSAERGLVLYTIMMNTRYGKGPYDYGVEKLISSGVFECRFTLHDGGYKWTDSGPLNERQLLRRYWGSFHSLSKQQPLDMIHHYFGSRIGFYFAWMGFYNKMLIPASIIGTICFVLGMILYRENVDILKDEVCNSSMKLCPNCHTKNCIYQDLRLSCSTAIYSYAFDNSMTFYFAVFMSFWAAVLMRLWKRQEAMLIVKWDLRSLEMDTSMRNGYLEKATKRKISRVTGEEEPYIPKMTIVASYAFTIFFMICLVIFNILCIFVIMLLSFYLSIVIIKYSPVENLRQRSTAISGVMGAVFSAIFVKVYSLTYHKITFWLTNIENPRTQSDFDNAYILKIYILAFVNNYVTMFYIAFFKGRFYTHPGDTKIYNRFLGIATDTCDPNGCILNVGIYMMVAMVFKQTLLVHAFTFIHSLFQKLSGRLQENVEKGKKDRPWETDYKLHNLTKLDIIQDYLEMAIQYGYVIFFVACFPLAPIFALINNLIQLRVDAVSKVCLYRRTVANRLMGLGAWNAIFQATTFMGVITNALVMVFTSGFISKAMYRERYYSLKGYINFTLSVFDTNDFADVDFDYKTERICYYSGHRYGPGHLRKYELNTFYWSAFSSNFIFIITFEHLLLAMTGLIAFFVPTMPFSVKQMITNQEDYYKKIRLDEAEEKMQKDHSSGPFDSGRKRSQSYFSLSALHDI